MIENFDDDLVEFLRIDPMMIDQNDLKFLFLVQVIQIDVVDIDEVRNILFEKPTGFRPETKGRRISIHDREMKNTFVRRCDLGDPNLLERDVERWIGSTLTLCKK